MKELNATTLLCAGFLLGLGFMAAQEVWWFATGMAGFCHG